MLTIMQTKKNLVLVVLLFCLAVCIIASIRSVNHDGKANLTTNKSAASTGKPSHLNFNLSSKAILQALDTPKSEGMLLEIKNKWVSLTSAVPVNVAEIESLMQESFDALGCSIELYEFLSFYYAEMMPKLEYPSGYFSDDYLIEKYLPITLSKKNADYVSSNMKALALSGVQDETFSIFYSAVFWHTMMELSKEKNGDHDLITEILEVAPDMADVAVTRYIRRYAKSPENAKESIDDMLDYYMLRKNEKNLNQLKMLFSDMKSKEACELIYESLVEKGSEALSDSEIIEVEQNLFENWAVRDYPAVTKIAIAKQRSDVIEIVAIAIYRSGLNEQGNMIGENSLKFHDWINSLPVVFDKNAIAKAIASRSLPHESISELKSYFANMKEYNDIITRNEKFKNTEY